MKLFLISSISLSIALIFLNLDKHSELNEHSDEHLEFINYEMVTDTIPDSFPYQKSEAEWKES